MFPSKSLHSIQLVHLALKPSIQKLGSTWQVGRKGGLAGLSPFYTAQQEWETLVSDPLVFLNPSMAAEHVCAGHCSCGGGCSLCSVVPGENVPEPDQICCASAAQWRAIHLLGEIRHTQPYCEFGQAPCASVYPSTKYVCMCQCL